LAGLQAVIRNGRVARSISKEESSMNRLFATFALAAVMAQLPSPMSAQEKNRPAQAIRVHTPNGWMLYINTDGSGLLQFGSSVQDGWQFKAGTLDVKQAAKDLQALTSDEKGGGNSHFVFSFESERKGPDKPGPARYTRDSIVIPALFKKAIEASDKIYVGHTERKVELLKNRPPGDLPKER
jgi:hypothetical protein